MMSSQLSFPSRERERERDRGINPVQEPAIREGKREPATGDQTPSREQVLRSVEWGSTVRLGVGTSLLWARDRGEGLIDGRELWWVSLGVGSKTQRLGGWPVKLQLSRSCAAACPGGWCSAVQLVSLETRRDERDQRSTTKAQGETSRDEL